MCRQDYTKMGDKMKGRVTRISADTVPLIRPRGFLELEAPRVEDSLPMKVVMLSPQHDGRFYFTKKYCWYSFLLVAEQTPRE
jgi:hypothetical protein